MLDACALGYFRRIHTTIERKQFYWIKFAFLWVKAALILVRIMVRVLLVDNRDHMCLEKSSDLIRLVAVSRGVVDQASPWIIADAL